jgi:hypothetical protein
MATASKQDLIALAKSSAAQAGIPPDHVPIFLGLIEQESNWNPNAVSSAGARGLGQLMPATGSSLGVKDPFDPGENLRGAATYFSQQLRRFGGDAGLALAAYNWGPGNASKLASKPSSVRIPNETQAYVPKIFEKSLNYGGEVAPSNFSATLFPKLAGVTQDAVSKAVSNRYSGQPDQIERAIKSGNIPGAPARKTAPAEQGPAMYAQAGAMDEITGQPQTATAAPALPGSDRPAARAATMDEFLKKSYGPLAEIADPFPKGFDQELMRIIKEA